MKKNIVTVLVIFLSFSLLLTACAQTTAGSQVTEEAGSQVTEEAGSQVTEEAGSQKDVLIVGVPTLLNSLDFEKPTLSGGQIIALMRDKGLRWAEQPYPYDPKLAEMGVYYPDYTKTEGRLIESYEVSPDAKSALFKLRKGVTSQYGNELTAKDVVYNLERAKALNGFLIWLWGVGGWTGPENITVIDDYTFRVDIPEPNGLIALINCHSWTGFMDATATKEHATEEDPWATEWVDKNNAGFSPYTLVEWNAGENMLWEGREDWWAGAPKVKYVNIRQIPESSNRVAMLEAGTIDIALNLKPEELDYLKTKEGIDVINIVSANSTWIFLNHSMEPFDDVKVRQAMMYTMPSDQIAEDIYKGYGTAMKSIVPPAIPGCSDYWPYEYNLEKAKELLSEAGYPDGFSFELCYDNSNPMDEAICVAWQASLAEIGVDLKLKSMMLTTLTDLKYKHALQACMETGLPVQPDINFACRLNFEPGIQLNFSDYKNDELKAKMIEGAKILDPEERIAFHEDIQKTLIDDVVAIPVISTNLQIAKRSNIKGKLVYDTVNDFYWDTLTKE